MVEYAFDVPTSRIRLARAVRARIQSKRPVSGVMLSIRRGRAVSRASLASPACQISSRSASKVESTATSLGASDPGHEVACA